jgi:hypothetical protein
LCRAYWIIAQPLRNPHTNPQMSAAVLGLCSLISLRAVVIALRQVHRNRQRRLNATVGAGESRPAAITFSLRLGLEIPQGASAFTSPEALFKTGGGSIALDGDCLASSERGPEHPVQLVRDENGFAVIGLYDLAGRMRRLRNAELPEHLIMVTNPWSASVGSLITCAPSPAISITLLITPPLTNY